MRQFPVLQESSSGIFRRIDVLKIRIEQKVCGFFKKQLVN